MLELIYIYGKLVVWPSVMFELRSKMVMVACTDKYTLRFFLPSVLSMFFVCLKKPNYCPFCVLFSSSFLWFICWRSFNKRCLFNTEWWSPSMSLRFHYQFWWPWPTFKVTVMPEKSQRKLNFRGKFCSDRVQNCCTHWCSCCYVHEQAHTQNAFHDWHLFKREIFEVPHVDKAKTFMLAFSWKLL